MPRVLIFAVPGLRYSWYYNEFLNVSSGFSNSAIICSSSLRHYLPLNCTDLIWSDEGQVAACWKMFEMAVLFLCWTVPVPNKMRKAFRKLDKAYQSFKSVTKILLKAIWWHASLHWIFENAPKNLNNNQISKKVRSACKIVIMQY